MPALKPLEDCRLYTFVDTGYLQGRQPEEVMRALCDGGADLVQLRAKGMPREQVRALAERLLPIAEAAGVWFVVNDHPPVAAAVRAPLCHLGQEDFFDAGYTHVAEVPSPALRAPSPVRRERDGVRVQAPSPVRREREGGRVLASTVGGGIESAQRPLIGLSTHAPAQAKRAIAAGAAYVAIGPVFATPTKPGRAPVTLDYVRWAAANVRLPWFAIGGIDLGNLDSVLAAGAQRICVVRAVLDARDVAGACREFVRRLRCAPS